ncbi:MAG: GIY-YIG nuclease family protein [Cyclobacteriaceae bacterium]|nr:GIY-YIG nuclease family protein [Cyclobacteriaceae bacterium]
MAYYFYILYSQSLNKYYIGHTNDLDGRLSQHNSNHRGFSGKVGDWKFVYHEAYSSEKKVYAGERETKQWKS